MDTQKPDDIPDDIWSVVLEIAAPWVKGATIDREGVSVQIASAIAEEREACARIAQHLNGWGSDSGKGGHAEHIAAVIRNRGAHDSDCAVHNEPAYPWAL